MPTRRFPPPWSVEEQDACFVVRDRSRQALAYVYYEEEAGRRSAAKLLTKDEARRIAANVEAAGAVTQAGYLVPVSLNHILILVNDLRAAFLFPSANSRKANRRESNEPISHARNRYARRDRTWRGRCQRIARTG